MGYLPYGTQVANGVIAAAYFSLVMPILGVIACLLKSRRPTLDAVVEKSQVLRSFSPSSSVDTLVTPSSSTDFPRKSLDQLRKSVEMFVPLPLWNTRPEVSVIAVNVTTHVDEHRD
ncbi:hypothetical protein FISHEDRAFT_77562 [Fistulina hepatica ATCC 64428]|uniref:Uncharacterized protein n=1 Tax=Fistulina hepatica ATCC 64428 TaxID=1128425 RepID=A0A0D7A0W0_9AGAR|nr:hypothetical protein FISHEDRAFT_77562 [Fistulina hepatica ATCC 64428]